MGEELDKPEKTFSPIDKENIYLKFGFNQVQGWKKTMEDYSIEFLESNEKKFMNIFGIFDGHGGREVPKYLQAHFLECLNKNKNFLTDKYKEGITETFFELDQKFTTKEAQEELVKYSEEFKPEKEKELNEINDLCSPNEKLTKEELEQVMAFNEVFDPRNIENANIAEFTGATGMIIAVCYKEILIAYAGNSRCLILDKDGKIINQTKDHTLLSENEKKRVDLARSFNDDEEEKKKGEDENIEFLDSTRGFGDLEFKGNEWIEQKDQEISVEPEIVFVPYNNAKYIIFGSHGMFEGDDNKINDEIGKYFFEEINKNKDIKFSEVIKNYFEKIIPEDKNKSEKNFGLDNMSCFVIELKNEEIEKFIKIRDEEIKEEKRKEEERKKKQKEEEMKRKAEEKKKREEERKRKEEEKNKKPEEKKDEVKPEEKKDEVKPEEKKEEVKEEVKQEEKKEEVKEEKKEEIKEEEKKEEKPEEKKEEVKENIEEKKEEKQEEKKEEVKPEEKQEEKKEEKQEEIKEEVKEEKPEEKQEENKIEIKVEKQEEKPEEIKEEKQEEKKEEIKPEEKQEEKKEEKPEENKIEIVTEQKEEKPEEIKEEKPEEKPEEKQEEKKEEVKEENKIEEEKKEEEVKVEIQIEKKEEENKEKEEEKKEEPKEENKE